MTIRIGLVHAVAAAIGPITRAFKADWPAATLLNLHDDTLSIDRSASADLTPGLSARIEGLADYAVLAGVDGVLFTCSAFGPAIDRAAARLNVPVLKPNQAMFTEALKQGQNIGMVATFAPAISTMEAEFREAAASVRPSATIRTVLAKGALDALNSGDAATHDRLVAEAAAELADCDAIMLAQFSMADAAPEVERKIGRAVLTSPRAAVLALKRAIEAGAPVREPAALAADAC